MNKCGECANYIGGGDWDLCCMEKHEGYPMGFLCYEDTDACEKFAPIECVNCDTVGNVHLGKYTQTMVYRGKQISIERWTFRCSKCGRAFEPSWMYQQNLGRINLAWQYSKEVVDEAASL